MRPKPTHWGTTVGGCLGGGVLECECCTCGRVCVGPADINVLQWHRNVLLGLCEGKKKTDN